MTLYADQPARRTKQIIGDILVLLAIVGALIVGGIVHGKVMDLQEPGQQVETAGGTLADSLRSAGEKLSGIVLIGDSVSEPFTDGADAADDIATAADDAQGSVAKLAWWLRLITAALPIILLLGYYLPGRVRFVREATATRRHLARSADLDLLALRGLARQPLGVLDKLGARPTAAWRRGDAEAITALAHAEIRRCGLDPARRLGAASPEV